MMIDTPQPAYICNAISGYWTSVSQLQEILKEGKLERFVGKAQITKITWARNGLTFQLDDHREVRVFKMDGLLVYVGEEQHEAQDSTQIASLMHKLLNTDLAYPIVSMRKEGSRWVIETRREHWL